ncbi:hypothetical protein C9J01_29470 [Photobacterium rosenbergii]|uniref:Uncharacterized protein n=1 Tax=Photobacterium rosenbergii TaxID=294936 RepID=A0A2T3MS69_9GAMM|nr:hypothetical protein C9J01_29470 [Photobacterium rosenbergii]
MVLWFCGSVVLWFCGSVVLWFCGSVVLWFCGSVVLWFCGSAGRVSERDFTVNRNSRLNNTSSNPYRAVTPLFHSTVLKSIGP